MKTDCNLSTLVHADYNHSAIDAGIKFIADPSATFLAIDSSFGNGDGMTHLMLSLGDELHRTGVKVVSYSAERLLREAAADASLLNRLTDSDCLLLDDVNFLFDKHTAVSADIFDMLAARDVVGKKTICTVAIAANDIDSLTPQKYLDLLYSAASCRIGTPTQDDKFKIAMAKIGNLGIFFDASIEEVIEQTSNIRELEGQLNRYVALRNIQRGSTTDAKNTN